MMISMRMFSFAAAAALLLPAAAACQQSSTTVGLALGMSDVHQQDDVVSPMIFRGAIASAGATLERRTARALFTVEGRYGEGRTNSEVMPRDVRQHLAHLSLTVLGAVRGPAQTGRGLTLYAGAGVSTLGSVTDVHARDATTGYTYWDWSYLWAHNLDVAGRAELSGRGRSVGLQVSASVVRLVSRPNNGKDFNAENARISESWPRSILRGSPEYAWDRPVLAARGEYRQRLGRRLQLRATYEVTYASTTRPQAVGMYVNRFMLGLLRPI